MVCSCDILDNHFSHGLALFTCGADAVLVLQAQTTMLQQQPNGLLIQSQALTNQLGAQPSVVHRQLSSQQIDSLQQQVSHHCSIYPCLPLLHSPSPDPIVFIYIYIIILHAIYIVVLSSSTIYYITCIYIYIYLFIYFVQLSCTDSLLQVLFGWDAVIIEHVFGMPPQAHSNSASKSDRSLCLSTCQLSGEC